MGFGSGGALRMSLDMFQCKENKEIKLELEKYK